MAAESIGFRTLAVRVTFSDLAAKAPLPCIAFWRQDHYIVVSKISKGRVFVADPAAGKLSYQVGEFRRSWCVDSQDHESQGIILLVEPTPKFEMVQDTQSAQPTKLARLVPYLRGYRKHLVVCAIAVVILAVTQVIMPFLGALMIDHGIGDRRWSLITAIAIAQLVLVVSRVSAETSQQWILGFIGMRINLRMRASFLFKLSRLPLSFFDSKIVGDLIQRVEDHDRIQVFLTNDLLQLVTAALSFLVFGGLLAYLNMRLFIIFTIGAGLYILFIGIFGKRRRLLDYQRFQVTAVNQSVLIELLAGMQDIKLHNAERQRRIDWEDAQYSTYGVAVQSLSLAQLQTAGGSIINEAKNLLLTWVSATAVLSGHMTIGTMVAVQYIIGQLNVPVSHFVNLVTSSQDASISLERTQDIEDLAEESTDDLEASSAVRIAGDIRIEAVSFSYRGTTERPVLSKLSLTIPSGKVTAIVGLSGSGKTSLIKLLMKAYKPSSGTIRVGDVDIGAISHRQWRGQCGVVMQDGYIFSDTISANIAISDQSPDPSRVKTAAQIANIHDFILALPLEYHTLIGRRGVGLSKGQSQRILIARALYNCPDYIFLDEATSALDAITERRVVECLSEAVLGKTVVIAAHRLSTIRDADQIVVLAGGTVVESGTHWGLVAQKGVYYDLVRNQMETSETSA